MKAKQTPSSLQVPSLESDPRSISLCRCAVANGDFAGSAFRNGRRTCLPAPCPDTSNINLWNILRNNIGKDLSKVSMPVELNEPLNTLQRMCEELEYTELLDKAADTEDPFERMVSRRPPSPGPNQEETFTGVTAKSRLFCVSLMQSEMQRLMRVNDRLL